MALGGYIMWTLAPLEEMHYYRRQRTTYFERRRESMVGEMFEKGLKSNLKKIN